MINWGVGGRLAAERAILHRQTRNEHDGEPASNGCSQPTKPAPNSAAPIQSPPKSQNHC